jgi:hypothetical protein
MAGMAEGTEITQLVGLFVGIERSEGLNVIDIQGSPQHFFVGPAILTAMVRPFTGFIALFKPVRATVVAMPPSPSWVVCTTHGKTTMSPITQSGTGLAAFATVGLEYDTADHASDFRSVIRPTGLCIATNRTKYHLRRILPQEALTTSPAIPKTARLTSLCTTASWLKRMPTLNTCLSFIHTCIILYADYLALARKRIEAVPLPMQLGATT